MRINKSFYKKYRKLCKEAISKKISLKLNQKAAKRLRKQADFVVTDKREYMVLNDQKNAIPTIFCKKGSPREVYRFLKKNINARN